jgi:magnesium-transporting ATPase (P-type)
MHAGASCLWVNEPDQIHKINIIVITMNTFGSYWCFCSSASVGITFDVFLFLCCRPGGQPVQIVHRHHFASHLKRMSVVVRIQEKFYAFIKVQILRDSISQSCYLLRCLLNRNTLDTLFLLCM